MKYNLILINKIYINIHRTSLTTKEPYSPSESSITSTTVVAKNW